MKELQPLRLNGSVCLKAQTAQEVFPEAGHQSTLVKPPQHQDSVVWKLAGARSRGQRVARGEWEQGSARSHTQSTSGPKPPTSSHIRGFCWEWHQDFRVSAAEWRAGASQRWFLICTAWGEADPWPLFIPGQGKFSSPVRTDSSDLLSDGFEALCTLQDYSNPKYLSSAHYPNKCLRIFIFFISANSKDKLYIV